TPGNGAQAGWLCAVSSNPKSRRRYWFRQSSGENPGNNDTLILSDAHATSRRIMKTVRVVLISTYELGRQPFGLASPAAWLRADGHDVVLADLSCSPLPHVEIAEADLVAFFLPMHTATRLFQKVIDRVRGIN